ncbi:jg22823 [Pararge aegeria aegeria]|uniref:Jg22823 protein n=1 Tax=Pararge aegeria aegeria TaxID=348720 RepID=A0A8S4RY72_9NEOP|nr:jg22823 [Pararge aegeria aegeria]
MTYCPIALRRSDVNSMDVQIPTLPRACPIKRNRKRKLNARQRAWFSSQYRNQANCSRRSAEGRSRLHFGCGNSHAMLELSTRIVEIC